MLSTGRLSARLAPALAVSLTLLALGCGDSTGLAKRYPVSGTVKFKGEPVPKGRIDFVPTSADGRAASGDIVDGSFTLTTAVPGDGALPGSYKVTVTSVEVDTTEMQKIAQGGQFHHDKTFLKANQQAKQLVPPRYKLADTSDLTAEVKEQSNSFTFELTE